MKRVTNFNPGPSTLPLAALERARDELVEFQGKGMSILEMSHRGKEYEAVHNQAQALLRELLDLPANFKILLLGGGATLQFAMVPLNLLAGGRSCDFTVTGAWAKKALADAKNVGKVRVVYDGEKANYMSLPDPATVRPAPDSAYLHLTSNETIGGVQWQTFPEGGAVPLVCDMSSDILSRPLPFDRFGLIYAGAQKNLGPAGLGIVLIRDDVLERCPKDLPAYLGYRSHAEDNSLYNTPPVFAVFLMKLCLEWLKEQGGLKYANDLAERRAALLYDAIDNSGGFYSCPVDKSCRSRMNVVFRLPTEDDESRFLDEAKRHDLIGLKGHRSVGGCRASIYNAMPLAGAQALADLMRDFAKKG